MAAFNERDIHSRIGGLAGRPAEAAFLRWLDAAKGYRLGERVFRYGLDQVPTGGAVAATFTPRLLHTPDFVSVGGHLWEVEGTRHESFQFKREKLDALNAWASQLTGKRQLRWFLYRSQDETAIVCSHEMVLWAINQPDAEYLPDLYDGKDGWQVPFTVFEQVLVDANPFDAEDEVAKKLARLKEKAS